MAGINFFMKKIIIFLGPPGSGKGTQAKNIVKKYNYVHISTGESLRTLVKENDTTPEEKEALNAMKEGHLVPDWLVFKVAFKDIDISLENQQGVVLDGAIRTLTQAKEYQEYFKKKKVENEVVVIEIHLDDEEAFSRLVHRKICSNCKQIYPNPEVKIIPEKCTVCSGELTVRPDDDELIAHNRISEQGSSLINPLHEYYRSTGALHVVDGKKGMEEVEKEIDHILKLEV